MKIDLSEDAKCLLATDQNLLCMGGPGSGKTTIALFKANEVINDGLLFGQKVLFLSFARSTISRVEEHSSGIIDTANRKSLSIRTYHGFAWSILKSHGYLLTPNNPIKLLSPADAHSALSSFETDEEKSQEQYRLFYEEGILHFDLFASLTASLLLKSSKLRGVISATYPLIILDEFQDTNIEEWRLIQELGKMSKLLVLADPEQRIYDFRGSCPSRIQEYIDTFEPKCFDFSNQNHRSSGTDIAVYGNELLKGLNKGKVYKNVKISPYQYKRNLAHIDLKVSVLKRRKKLIEQEGSSWSLVILVPTKNLMLQVSKFLHSKQKVGKRVAPSISNEAAIDSEAPQLAADVLAYSLSITRISSSVSSLVERIIKYLKGRRGSKGPRSVDKPVIDALHGFLTTGNIRGAKRKLLIEECTQIVDECMSIEMTGDPEKDWIAIRNLFSASSHEYLTMISEDVRYLRFLNKGTQLRSQLASLWKSQGNYVGAPSVFASAFVNEHFTASNRSYQGVHVMTLHKSKGKQFSEVIIYEGYYNDRIVRDPQDPDSVAKSKLLLRVGVTRAEKNVEILTPSSKSCCLL